MKKVALLFTLVLCVGALNGMEAQNIGNLPTDIHNEMIRLAFATSDNLLDTIKAFQFASALRGIPYDNLKDFTNLVHILANKFKTTNQVVAENFNTPTAKNYINLGKQLVELISRPNAGNTIKIIQLIEKNGADVNYSNSTGSLLSKAIQSWNVESVKLLLEYGAKQQPGNLPYIQAKLRQDPKNQKAKIIEQLLIDAMQKQQK